MHFSFIQKVDIGADKEREQLEDDQDKYDNYDDPLRSSDMDAHDSDYMSSTDELLTTRGESSDIHVSLWSI